MGLEGGQNYSEGGEVLDYYWGFGMLEERGGHG